MKIIVIGGTGTVGQAVAAEFSARHEVVVIGKSHGDLQVDITSIDSIKNMYESVGKFDALVSTTGIVKFSNLTAMHAEDYEIGLKDKLMGQVNLVLLGLKKINDAGSFTLTSGILDEDPIRFGSSAAMVNGAVNAFVKSAAIEMPRSIRINAVSPTVLTESMHKYAEYFHGFESVSAQRVALAYSKSVEGLQTGQVYKVWH